MYILHLNTVNMIKQNKHKQGELRSLYISMDCDNTLMCLYDFKYSDSSYKPIIATIMEAAYSTFSIGLVVR